MDFIVRTTLDIEMDVNDAKRIRDAGASDKRKENKPSSSSLGKKQRTHAP